MADQDNVDAALEVLGPLGPYTVIQYTLQSLAAISICQQIFSVIFTGQTNRFHCPAPGNSSLSNFNVTSEDFNISSLEDGIVFGDSCMVRTTGNTSRSMPENRELYSCSAFDVEYENSKDFSFLSDFDLVCGREYLGDLSQTFLTVGQCIATFAFPYFVDRHGRKPVALICAFLSILSSCGLAASVNYTMFAVFKVLVGFFVQGLMGSVLTLTIEVPATKHRALMFTCLGSCLWSLATIILIPVAYFLRHYSWRSLEFAFVGFYSILLILPMYMDESLRWLSANSKKAETMKLLRRASKWNGKNVENVIQAFTSGRYEDNVEDNVVGLKAAPYGEDESQLGNAKQMEIEIEDSESKPTSALDNLKRKSSQECGHGEILNFCHLFTDPMLRLHVVFCGCAFFFNSLTFYSLTYLSSTYYGNLYVNFTINVLMEIPQAFFVYLFLDKLGRRLCFSLFSLGTGVALVSAAVLNSLAPEQSIAILVFSMLGKLFITGSYNTVYTYTPELFPTNVRNMGVGTSYLSARVGGMLSPFAEMLMKEAAYAPGVICGVGNLLLSVAVFLLPETTKHQLPQTLAEMKRWKHKKQ